MGKGGSGLFGNPPSAGGGLFGKSQGGMGGFPPIGQSSLGAPQVAESKPVFQTEGLFANSKPQSSVVEDGLFDAGDINGSGKKRRR